MHKEFLCNYIKEHQGELYRFAYSYVKNREDALDVLQEAVIKAIEAADGIRNIDSIRPWLFRIIINEANGLFRRNKKNNHINIEDAGWEADVEEYSDNIAEYISRNNVLGQVLELDERYRVIIILRYYEELKLSEIGKVLDISENTVKTRLYKALNMLKKALGEDWR